MAPEMIVTLATLIVTSLTSIVLALINNRKLGVVDAKADQIHVLTNSTLTAANTRIEALERLVTKLMGENTAVQAAAGAAAETVASAAVTASEAVTKLDEVVEARKIVDAAQNPPGAAK